jgi:hypothetical protein
MLSRSTAIERPGVSATPCAPRGPKAASSSAQRLFAEEHGARVAPQHLVHALRVLPRPGLDAGPRRVAQQALLQQPAADAAVRLLVAAGKGQAHQALAAIGLGDAHPARALDLQHQRVQRVGQVRNFPPAQRGARLGQGFDFLPRVPGPAWPAWRAAGTAARCGWPLGWRWPPGAVRSSPSAGRRRGRSAAPPGKAAGAGASRRAARRRWRCSGAAPRRTAVQTPGQAVRSF